MDTEIEKRKLAAVMFADIEGYTALFQKNETNAFELLEQHKQDLRGVSEKHNGHIVKYYGDGSLTLFNSVIEATRCAMDLQQVSSKHHIALRIGIHMGEMIEKDEDVYGDAVNVASRIQALGTSGSILVSKTVENELKNHPDIITKSLGSVFLKNVRKPVEVFALANPGLPIPHALPGAGKRKLKRIAYVIVPLVLLGIGAWLLKNKINSKLTQIGDKCIIIPPFISHVPTGELDYFANMASSELIKAMSESAKANTIPYSTMLLYSNANVASFIDNPALSRKLGAEIEVRGEYTLEGKNLDTLRISLSILDLKQNRLFQTPIPDVKCASANKRDCLEDVKNILVGYWKSKESNLLQLTTDSAYIHFHIAQKKWADPKNEEEIKSHLLKALRYDPKFLDAWFLLLDLFQNDREYQSGLDSIAVIENLFPDLDQRQQSYLNYYKADFRGNNIQAFNSFLKEYRQNPNSLFVNTSGMVMALENLNDPLVTLEMFNRLPSDSMDLSTCVYCYTRFSVALKAYVELFDLKNAGLLAERIKPFATKTSHFISLLKYYTLIKDTVSINEVIRSAVKLSDEADEEAYLDLLIARMATLNGDLVLQNIYASKAILFYTKQPHFNLARCYLLVGRLREAKELFLKELKKQNIDRNTFAYLGIIYAREGDRDAANKMIERLDKIKQPFDMGYTPYIQGRIKAHLGEFDAALNSFKIALEEGIRFLPTSTFLNDPDMIVMNSNKEYLSLLAKNRLNKIE